MLPFIFITFLLFATINCKVDFCDENQLPLTSPLQFTKELSRWDYAVDSKFKSLHCCARGYLSVEWFKNGRPYPWTGDDSSFIIYPESANQTIYTQAIMISDAGNYTCRIHNDTMQIVHITELKVFDSSGYMENPLPTYSPPEITMATVGQTARLYCEAFVGHIDLPDATSEVTWAKEGNDTLSNPRFSVKKVQRENSQIVGEYLIIDNVDWSDFGTYVCTISNTGDQKIVMKTQLKALNEWSRPICLGGRLTFFLGVFILICVIIIIYNLIRYYMKIESPLFPIWYKIVEMRKSFNFNKKPPGSKLVLIYGEGDNEFVDNKFLPLLNQQCQLYILPYKIAKPGKISDELRRLCRQTEKVVILLSRHLTDQWKRENISRFLEDIISSSQASYCVLLLEPLPEDNDHDNDQYLRCIQNKVTTSVWDEKIVAAGHPFWTTRSTNTAQPDLRVLSSSVVITASAPFRYSFMRLNRSSQPNVVPV